VFHIPNPSDIIVDHDTPSTGLYQGKLHLSFFKFQAYSPFLPPKMKIKKE